MYRICLVIFLVACGGESSSNIVDGVSDNEHRIFVTSASYDGEMGGLSGADTKCQAAAAGVGLKRNYLAMLSTSTTDLSSRFKFKGAIYKFSSSATKDLVLVDPNDLFTAATLAEFINYDESGQAITGEVWSGSYDNGTYALSACSDWSSSGGSGRIGLIGAANGAWLDYGSDDFCSELKHLYCLSI